MDNFFHWGINLILWLQQFSPMLDLPFKTITQLGEETTIMILFPILYWCWDRAISARLGVILFFATYISAAAKVYFNQPRPFEYDSQVKKLMDAPGRGFPSIHTEITVVAWGYLGAVLRKRWFWILAGVLMVLVPLSRLYLGLHFPGDLLGGYVIGGVCLGVYLLVESPAEQWLKQRGFAWQLGAAVILPVLLLVLLPTADETAVTVGGLMLGGSIGFVLERRWVKFTTRGSWWQYALRLLIGIGILMGLRYGLKAVFASLAPELLFRLIRYIIMGLWLAVGAPWLFLRTRLAKAE